jgi:hypothetical protein
MDGTRFDHLTKWLIVRTNSRRGLFRLGLGSGLGVPLFGQAAESVAACRRNGKPCD